MLLLVYLHASLQKLKENLWRFTSVNARQYTCLENIVGYWLYIDDKEASSEKKNAERFAYEKHNVDNGSFWY